MQANWKPEIDDDYGLAEPPLQPKREVHLQAQREFGSSRPFGSPHPEQRAPSGRMTQVSDTRILSANELLGPPSFSLVSRVSKMPSPLPEPRQQAQQPQAQKPIAPAQRDADATEPQGYAHPTWNGRRGLSRRVLNMACSYMEDNLGENFSLDDLARAVGVSRFHFSRLFRVSTGESPMVYSLRLRIERAKDMLMLGDRKICEIAVALGFFDQSHFSRTFRRMTGLSPGEYVRMCDVAEVAV